MSTSRDTPIGAIVKGVVAGLIGTMAMDLVWYARYRASGGGQGFTAWDSAAGVESYDGAPAPAQVGRRVAEGLLQTELPPKTARLMTNAVHWATGAGWGAAHGVLHGSLARATAVGGLATGATAWATSYATLGPIGIYKPIWEYDIGTLWKDLSAHLVFGATTGIAFKLLASPGD